MSTVQPLLPYAFAKTHSIFAWYKYGTLPLNNTKNSTENSTENRTENSINNNDSNKNNNKTDNDNTNAFLCITKSLSTSKHALSEVMQRHGVCRAEHIHTLSIDAFAEALQAQYGHTALQGSAQSVADAAGQEADLNRLMDDIPEIQDLLDSAADAPIIRLINALLTQAVREGASDIHIEPFETDTVVRLRVDGTLRDIARPKRSLHAALVSRIKIMANLDIAERRLPQDGRMALRVAGRPVDVRVSTLPVGSSSNSNERAVLRLLDKTDARLDLTALGMAANTRDAIDRLIKQPYGIVLVTGPTGSGKTTTLYSAIKRLDASTTNILTVEDPIEYELAGIGQTQVNGKIDLNFATALRAILRQDPDVVMIGEIRDVETADIAVQASLTGHLVLATLHTNDAVGAVTRLADMGVEPFLLSSSLIGVVAQRLLRKLCEVCKVAVDSPNIDGINIRTYKALGCAACNNTGYSGRLGIYELLTVDAKLAQAIHQRLPEADLRTMAQAQGLTTLRQDAQRLIDQGITSLAEVERVTRLT
jgi:general secretion pathway protein E